MIFARNALIFESGGLRRFYEEVLGFDCDPGHPVSLGIRKGSEHSYAVVETGQPSTMEVMTITG